MTSILALLSSLAPELRPTHKEVELYAQVIASHEGRSRKALSKYRYEAELQIWVSRWSALNSQGERFVASASPTQTAPRLVA